MKRRDFLYSLGAGFGLALPALGSERRAGSDLANPYAKVEWDRWDFVHSMSHQHQGQSDTSRDVFREMGYRHFAFSNYYPSDPTPLPEEYQARHPEIVASPNAEQHSFTDAGLHFNGIGSLLATGYGKTISAQDCEASPLVQRFDKLNLFQDNPSKGVYRLDITLEEVGENAAGATAALTIGGGTECVPREEFADRGAIEDKPLPAGAHSLYVRMSAPELEMELQYDKQRLRVTRCRLMQGTNRPWREMFRAALDGEMVDGRRVGGLKYPDGGGITLNHPSSGVSVYTPMLDYDPRVLGIEVWNQHMGFGEGSERDGTLNLHFYRLWDDLLRTGRRCWGFFVKDHLTYRRGRNVLLVPPGDGKSADEREAAALGAYRTGTFFGSVAALAVDEFGEVTAPYDYSAFRFRRIEVRRDSEGNPVALEVEVTGNDAKKRPGLQIRFITDAGTALVVDGAKAEFPLERDAMGRLVPSFIRVEAFAYPSTHLRGTPLTAETMRKLNVHEISQINEHVPPSSSAGPLQNPAEVIPIVDMIFSQPLMRI